MYTCLYINIFKLHAFKGHSYIAMKIVQIVSTDNYKFWLCYRRKGYSLVAINQLCTVRWMQERLAMLAMACYID